MGVFEKADKIFEKLDIITYWIRGGDVDEMNGFEQKWGNKIEIGKKYKKKDYFSVYSFLSEECVIEFYINWDGDIEWVCVNGIVYSFLDKVVEGL